MSELFKPIQIDQGIDGTLSVSPAEASRLIEVLITKAEDARKEKYALIDKAIERMKLRPLHNTIVIDVVIEELERIKQEAGK